MPILFRNADADAGPVRGIDRSVEVPCVAVGRAVDTSVCRGRNDKSIDR